MEYSVLGLIMIAVASFGVLGAVLLILKVGGFGTKSEDTIEN